MNKQEIVACIITAISLFLIFKSDEIFNGKE